MILRWLMHFCNYEGREVLVYSLIDVATRFHGTQILPSQSARDLHEAIMSAWVKWARAPRFLLVVPRRSHLVRQFIEQLGAQSTTVPVKAAEVSRTRGLVERHGACVRSMVEKMDFRSPFDKATSAKNIMSRIRGYSPSQWVLATQPRTPQSLMTIEAKTMNSLVRFVSEMQLAVLSFLSARIRDFAGPQSLPLVLTG